MPNVISIDFIYLDEMGFDSLLSGTKLVDGHPYELRYTEHADVDGRFPPGVYVMHNGKYVEAQKIQITGNSYVVINRNTGETRIAESNYGASIDRYDPQGRDLVEIIKRSVVKWEKVR